MHPLPIRPLDPQVTLSFLESPEEMQHDLWPPIAAILELSPSEVDRIATARLSQRSCSLALVTELLSNPTALALTHPRTHAALSAAATGAAASATSLAAMAARAVAALLDAAPGAIATGTSAVAAAVQHARAAASNVSSSGACSDARDGGGGAGAGSAAPAGGTCALAVDV